MHLLLTVVRTACVFSVPLFAGLAIGERKLSRAYLYGQVLLWAAFEVMAVPMICFRASFQTLFLCSSAVWLLFLFFGFKRFKTLERVSLKPNLFFVLAFLLILFQVGMYIVGQHLDEDDARWLAEAGDALSKNRMLLHNPATGEYVGTFKGEVIKDVASPWSMYVAFLCRLTGLSPAAAAHTVYAPVLLLLSYTVYANIGRQLFKGRTEQGIFLFTVALIHMFMANEYTQPAFALTRIWQGKAVVAAVMIPLFLLEMLQIEAEDSTRNWLYLLMTGEACCLLSGMGIAIGALMIGIYGLYSVFFCRNLKRLPLWLLSTAVPVMYGLLYFWLKG